MAKVEIRHKCITIAREAARKDSTARITGRSVFIKRYYKSYRLISVVVSEKQRNCRDMFAEAQKMAKEDLKNWNRKRHWERLAKKHKIKGANRMAVSCFYKMLKENSGKVDNISEKRKYRTEEKKIDCKVIMYEDWRTWRGDWDIDCLAG